MPILTIPSQLGSATTSASRHTMARQESDREDLLRDATALVERIELQTLPGDGDQPGQVIVGFRRDRCASLYFGPDPVYHFNAQGELRRAHVGGELIKAERGCLVAMQRDRSGAKVRFTSRPLSDAESAQLLTEAERRMRQLRACVAAEQAKIVGQVPGDADVLGQVVTWLNGQGELKIARSPHAR